MRPRRAVVSTWVPTWQRGSVSDQNLGQVMGEVFDPVFDDTCCAQGGGASSRQRAKSGRGSCIFAGMANRPPMPITIPTPITKPSERIKDGTGHTLFFWRALVLADRTHVYPCTSKVA